MTTDHPERRDISPKGAAVRRLFGAAMHELTCVGEGDEEEFNFQNVTTGQLILFLARAWEDGRLYGEAKVTREAVAATKEKVT